MVGGSIQLAGVEFGARRGRWDMTARSFAAIWRAVALAATVAACAAHPRAAVQEEPVQVYDFTTGTQGWTGNPQVRNMRVASKTTMVMEPQPGSAPKSRVLAEAAGLEFECAGNDAWIEGPAADYPETRPLVAQIRMRSGASDGSAELFYGRGFKPGYSVPFTVRNDGGWHEYRVALPPLGARARLRLDPAQSPGTVAVEWIRILAQPPELALPPGGTPTVTTPPPGATDPAAISVPCLTNRSKPDKLELCHSGTGWGAYRIRVMDEDVACGHNAENLVVDAGGTPESLPLAVGRFALERRGAGRGFTETVEVRDSRGARWTLRRDFTPGPKRGTIEVEASLSCDRDGGVHNVSWLALLAGLGTHGARKHQALFAGVEYLGDEPSSSEKSVRGPNALHRVPDRFSITFPLMALENGDRYVGVEWDGDPANAAVFDSPDRVFDSDAHLMALWAPGVGELRRENALCAHTPLEVKAGSTLRARATILGGGDPTVLGAVRQFVELRGMPPVPEYPGGFRAACDLMAKGWLDSEVCVNGLYRHAVWPGFEPQPAADAAMHQQWLASRVERRDRRLAERLRDAADAALERLPDRDVCLQSVGHGRLLTPALLWGDCGTLADSLTAGAGRQIGGFDAQGILHYKKLKPDDPDYSSTHGADHTNGIAGQALAAICEAAALTGDDRLVSESLRLLDAAWRLYGNGVPRGAQPWEIPLHAPDILASANLVKAYALGYEMSREPRHLDHARYWAWSGVPFVYLAKPAPGAIGDYATIAVLGATNWNAPYWIGQPVQWCGLVYASALRDLARHDPAGPWARIADGITATGLQMTWPAGDTKRQGLLPDYFLLTQQVREGPAINPGTVQTRMPELFGEGTLEDFRALPLSGWWVTAPCAIRDATESDGRVELALDGFGDLPYQVLISRVRRMPRVSGLDEAGKPTKAAGYRHDAHRGLLILNLTGPSRVAITP
jgi:hypothetical protein